MKKQLLKITNIFIVANMIFLNTRVSANYTKAYTIRQKMTSFLEIEKHNKEEKIEYKYLAEQLCIRFNLPFTDKELTFNTPFGDAKIDIKSSSGIFIDVPRINKYEKIAKVLDEVLTKEGRKQLANIILEYLKTNPDPNYRNKPFVAYEFKQSKFFDVIDEESKLCFNFELYTENCKELKELKEKLETCKQTPKTNLRSIKDKKEKDKIKKVRKGSNELNKKIKELDKTVKNYKKKLDKAKEAATALCAILMISEPHYRRSFDGGKHERALMCDILNSGMKYADAFEKFVPSRKGGATLAYEYSTDVYNGKELLESDNYSEDEESAVTQKNSSLM